MSVKSGRTPSTALVIFAGVITVTVFAVSPLAQGPPNNRPTEKARGHDAEPKQVLVKFKRVLSAEERAQLNAQLDADADDPIGGTGVRKLHSRRFDAETLANFLSSHPDVEYAEPDYIVQAIQAPPDDTLFPQLWGLQNTSFPGADIHALAAWDVTTGSKTNVVAVIDTGIDYTHPDLAANVWSAPTGFTANGIVCAVGTHGYNAITRTCDPMDDHNHGTHVSGTIGGAGNNGTGVAGVNWNTSIIAAKFLSASGSGSTSGAIDAIEFLIQTKAAFAATNGADIRVLSNSWGGGGFSQALADEITKANNNGMLFVAAAGNNNSNNDTSSFYPSNYTNPNVISVAATTSTDDRAYFSNYGSTTVDLGAPGYGIISTTIGNTYSNFSGTSMATPHVSGAAALILSVCDLSTAALKALILNTVDPIAALNGITVTGGRLNVANAVSSCSSAPAPPPSPPPAPTGLTAAGGNAKVTLSWAASSGATSYNLRRSTTSGGSYGSPVSIGGTSYQDNSVTNGTKYYYVVTAVNGNGESGNSNEASATPTAPPTIPGVPTGVTATQGPGNKRITVTWSAQAGATSYVLRRGTTSGSYDTNIVVGAVSTYANGGLRSGKTYYYVVAAQNSAGTSGYSAEVNAKAK